MYRYIEPEVAGHIGDKSICNYDIHPPKVDKLQYVFDGWLGGEIIEAFPVFIVSDRLKMAIEIENLTGCHFDMVEVSKGGNLEETNPEIELPKFHWLIVNAKACDADFGIAEDHRLVVSQKGYNVLQGFNLSDSTFEDY